MNDYELPLYELFTRLRQADIPLGIDEYRWLLNALRAGFGIESKEALAQLCRMLWIKSAEDERLFTRHFDQAMMQIFPPELPATSFENTTPPYISTAQSEIDSSSNEAYFSSRLDKQAAKAILHYASEDEIPYSRFISSDEYFPVTRRQMKQSWRYLRRPVQEPGPAIEIDVDATLDEVCRTGQMLNLKWLSQQRNYSELLLLIDQGGSMVPFHAFSRRLVETAQRGRRMGSTSIYYFHNSPTTHLYRTPTFRDAKTVNNVMNTLSSNRAGIMIFSDAGAARRGFNQTRLDLTMKFLNQLSSQFRYIAWLNPVPHHRWINTTANNIQEIVSMFEINRRGLDGAISLLRGRPMAFIRSTEYRHNE